MARNEDSEQHAGEQDRGEAGRSHAGKDPEAARKRNYKFLWIFGGISVIAIIGVLIYHFLYGQYHVTTKDAYVNGNMIRLQPQVTGTVTFIGADQTQPVKVGQILVQLDAKDAVAGAGESQPRANCSRCGATIR